MTPELLVHHWQHAYHLAERLHLAYGFPLMVREIIHWTLHSSRARALRLLAKQWGKLWKLN